MVPRPVSKTYKVRCIFGFHDVAPGAHLRLRIIQLTTMRQVPRRPFESARLSVNPMATAQQLDSVYVEGYAKLENTETLN